MIAYCGLTCDTCPIYLATTEQDKVQQQTMRVSIARLCTETYGMALQPEDIKDCDGCLANAGRLFSGCLNCGIRTCARGRNLENCAYCDEFACAKLSELLSHEEGAKTKLDEIRTSGRP
jgi:hypothetical protein